MAPLNLLEAHLLEEENDERANRDVRFELEKLNFVLFEGMVLEGEEIR